MSETASGVMGKPVLLFVINETYFFMSLRLVLAEAAEAASFAVHVAALGRQTGPLETNGYAGSRDRRNRVFGGERRRRDHARLRGISQMNPRLEARFVALKRRLFIALKGDFDPFPEVPDGLCLSPSQTHFADYDKAPLRLSWFRAAISNPLDWQEATRAKLTELTGYRKEEIPPSVRFTEDVSIGGNLRGRRVYLKVGEKRDAPVTLVWGEAHATPLRVMLCLHGHNSGAHLSWGEVRMPADPLKIANGADYALQAARRGFLAVCIEQACFGERRERLIGKASPHPCFDAAHNALLLGRTLLGERVSDISAVIDWLIGGDPGPAIDPARIYAMGNSTGGDASVFAAALDRRIAGVMAGGCVGRFRITTGRREACPDIIIPGILNWLEYDDVLALCAPRPVVALSGRNDHIYPFSEVEETVARAREVYAALRAGEKLRALPADGGHRFYPEVAWPAFLALVEAGDIAAAAGSTDR